VNAFGMNGEVSFESSGLWFGNTIPGGATDAYLVIAQGLFMLDAAPHALGLDYTPQGLNALTLGVDYEQRPDRTPGDVDRYVQYESPVVPFAGWADWAVTALSVGSHTPYVNDGGHVTVPTVPLPDNLTLRYMWEPGLATGWPYPTWSDGTEIGQQSVPTTGWLDLVTEYSHPLTIPLHLVPEQTASIWVQPGWLGAQDVPYVETVDTAQDNNFQYGWSLRIARFLPPAAAYYQMPRWRYWAIGVPPLRQRQRDDGLGLEGHPRLPLANAGSSAQSLSPRALNANRYL
jgi:hypothetical protein